MRMDNRLSDKAIEGIESAVRESLKNLSLTITVLKSLGTNTDYIEWKRDDLKMYSDLLKALIAEREAFRELEETIEWL